MKSLVLWYLLCLGGGVVVAFVPILKNNDQASRRKTTGLALLRKDASLLSKAEQEALLQSYGEKSRIYRRDMFTSADWVYTRRPDRFFENILSTFGSGVLRQLYYGLGFILAISVFVVGYNDYLVDGWTDMSTGIHHDPAALSTHLPALKIPLVAYTVPITALGLLLTFRTNVSYARWNEARTAWGVVINESRSLVRMGCIWATSYSKTENEADATAALRLLQRLGEAVCCFSRSVMNRTLPPQEDEENYLLYLEQRISDPAFALSLRNAKHRPTVALAEISQILVDIPFPNPLYQVEMERVVTSLCNALGTSERIFTSPVPTFYTIHTNRFLNLWLLTLPCGLYDSFSSSGFNNHLLLIPVCVVISAFLLGIEELATQMEEPFSILPMEKMCETSIRIPILEQVERSTRALLSSPSTSTSECSPQQQQQPPDKNGATDGSKSSEEEDASSVVLAKAILSNSLSREDIKNINNIVLNKEKSYSNNNNYNYSESNGVPIINSNTNNGYGSDRLSMELFYH